MTPGDLGAIQAFSDQPRAGNVYLLRGWIGIFSYGVDGIGKEINDSGVRAHVYQDDQWSSVAKNITERYKNVKTPEPLVLVGHSYGADDVIRIARVLNESKIPVDLIVTLDPVTPPELPNNIRRVYNLYQSNGMMDKLPFLRGIPLPQDPKFTGELANIDIRKDRTDLLEPGTDHFNIEKKEKIHAEVVKQVLLTCTTRVEWVNAHFGQPPAVTAPRLATSQPATQRNLHPPVAATAPAQHARMTDSHGDSER